MTTDTNADPYAGIPLVHAEAEREIMAALPDTTLQSQRAAYLKDRNDTAVRKIDLEIARRGIAPAADKSALLAAKVGISAKPEAESYRPKLPEDLVKGAPSERVSGLTSELGALARDLALPGDKGSEIASAIASTAAKFKAAEPADRQTLASQWAAQTLQLAKSEERLEAMKAEVIAFLGRSPGDVAKGLAASPQLLEPSLFFGLLNEARRAAYFASKTGKPK
ncbi:MAG: hypothetical protein EKK41_16930 [Hyphomicrobiales bacterium]|nr:MAG: hypothetical protein EKK41_16930 [Hyphomicrobiales bacterium]